MKRIEQIRARLAEIQAKLTEFQNSEAYTAETLKQMEDLTAEFQSLTKELSVLEASQAAIAAASASAGRKTAPVVTPEGTLPQVGASAKDKFGGFDSSGDFLMAVKERAEGTVHKLFQSAHYEKTMEEGGVLVPDDISTEIQTKLKSQESLFAQTRPFTISGNNLSMPVDETQPWNSGIQAFWLGEGKKFTETKAKLTQASWKLNKIGAFAVLTDELAEDAPAMESYVKNAAPEAIMHALNEAILTGDGVSKPRGLLNSGFTVTVAKEAGQAADTIVAKNVINMYSRMIPMARAGAVWLINAACEPQLMTMTDENGNFIYLAPGSQMNQSPYGLLLGRPVIPMMSALPELGTSGDICFVNLKYYYSIQKAGIKQAQSIHMYFDRELTAFRFSMRVDGGTPFKSPVKTQYGDYQMSAFVKLEDR